MGNYSIGANGTADNPIIVQACTGERPVIDGLLTVNGDYVRVKDIEIKSTGWTEGREPGEGAKPDILTVNGDNCEMINLILHDGAQGIAWWGQGGTMYGCLSYHNGYKSSGTAQGHGAYVQNNTPRKTCKHNIVFDNFGWGLHCWSNDADKIHRITLDGNISFCNGSPWPGTFPNFTLANTGDNEEELTAQNNMTYQPAGENTQNAVGQTTATDVTFDNNYTPEHTETGGVANFLSNTGNYDGPAVGNQVYVIENEYDANRLHVAIYNQAGASSINVDVSAYFSNGDTVQVRNVQDYFVDIQELTVAAGVLVVDMQAINRTVAAPYSWTAPGTSFPYFGAFVLEKI